MSYFLHFASANLLYISLPLLAAFIFFRKYMHKSTVYKYSLASELRKKHSATQHPYKKIFYACRFLSLLILAFLLGRPQIVDSKSTITVEGIDIVLVLDVSGSMEFPGYDASNRSRFAVAKEEAIRFIEKRANDAIALVIFGKDAISRCPLTMDKNILKDTVTDLELGIVDPDGTMLATAVVTAANRLKHSTAKSKVVILLTDGEPSEGDMNPEMAIEIAKQLGIKIYTVGIGSEEDQVFYHPIFGQFARVPKVNKELLVAIAQKTGGKFFMAHNANDMRSIYDTIDSLERQKHEAVIFSNYFDVFVPFVFFVCGLLLFELFFSTFVWFGI